MNPTCVQSAPGQNKALPLSSFPTAISFCLFSLFVQHPHEWLHIHSSCLSPPLTHSSNTSFLSSLHFANIPLISSQLHWHITQIVSNTWTTLVHHPTFLQPQFRLHSTLTTSPVSQNCLSAKTPSFFLQSMLLLIKQFTSLFQHLFSPWNLSFSHQHKNSNSSLSHGLFLFILFNPDCPSSCQPMAENLRAHNIPVNYTSQPNTDWVFPLTHSLTPSHPTGSFLSVSEHFALAISGHLTL